VRRRRRKAASRRPGSTLADLQREGKVRHIGVSNFDADELARAEAIAPVASLQPPYSVLRRDIERSRAALLL
jgi:aryl-alcohol dehydrogenase-like predicted oxidoreductase